jgi:hypothetical protein
MLLLFNGNSQVVEKRVNDFIRKKSLDTFFVYSYRCSGCIYGDSCNAEYPHYLIWKGNNDYFIKRFDYCKAYKTLPVDTINPLKFYLLNIKIIDKEVIKEPTCYEIRKRNGKVDTLIRTYWVDHYPYHYFQFPFDKKSKFKEANTYYLDFHFFDDGRKNIYYNYNQQTKFKALIDLVTKLISRFKEKNSFEPE